MGSIDKEINELFRELDRLKALGEGSVNNPSLRYMQTLYTLRDKCRERTASLQSA